MMNRQTSIAYIDLLTVLMSLFVVGFNRLLWNRLYDIAQERTRL